MNQNEYADAKELLRKASEAYYKADEDGSIILSDAEYDDLLRKVDAYEKANGITADVAGQAIGSGANLSGDYKHDVKMLSLDNVFSEKELDDWFTSVENRVTADRIGYAVEPKMDGLALSIHYDNGKAVRVVTRGDGTTGEDVTYCLKNIANLPADVPGFTGEVRGEAIFTHDQFKEANVLRAANKAKAFANARAGVAGALRGSKDRSYSIPFNFVAYDTADAKSVNPDAVSHRDVMNVLDAMGFTTARSVLPADLLVTKTKEKDQVKEIVDAMESRRAELDYETDGIVIKANMFDVRQQAGFSSRAPHWAIAYKFPAVEVSTDLLAVDWEVGRTGVITPRAILSPVMVGGTTITYATLHNFEDVARKDIRIFDKVLVKRAGEVIPRVEGPMVALRKGIEQTIVPPTECPNCGGPVRFEGAFLKCENGAECSLARNIEYAVARDALDIEGLGSTQVDALVNSGRLMCMSDLFYLTEETLASTPGTRVYSDTPANQKKGIVGQPVPLGETTAKKILAEIEKAKSQPLSRFLTAMAIPGTGRSLCRSLASHFETIEALVGASVEEIAEVEKIGKIKAEKIRKALDKKDHDIEALQHKGISLTEPKAKLADPNAEIVGKSVVVTGSMNGALKGSRNEVNEKLAALGAKPSSSVSKDKTFLLICNDPNSTSSKVVNAKKYGVRIISEADFEKEFMS